MSAYDDHALAIDVVFDTFGIIAEYEAPNSSPIDITVYPVEQDIEGEMGNQVLARQGLYVQVRKSELSAPAKGATLTYNDTTYSVRDPRDADAIGVLWLLPLVKI
jgi:hypothetical protein